MRFGSNSQTGVGVSSSTNSHCDDTVVLDFDDDDDDDDDNEVKKDITEYKNSRKEEPIQAAAATSNATDRTDERQGRRMTMKQRCGNLTKSICSVVRSIRRNGLPWWNEKEETVDRRRFLGFRDEQHLRWKIDDLFKSIKGNMWCSETRFNHEYLSLKRILFDMMDEWEVSCYDPDFLSHDDFEWKEQNFMNAVNETLFFYAAVTSAECHISSLRKDMHLYEVQRYIRGFETGELAYDPILNHILDGELCEDTSLSDLSYEERKMEMAHFRYRTRPSTL
mmetsp:Transcript_47493/g.115764  ORF Transcript_47493/g.115764 Transcript_47493/m.115764 type:complete len:279 (-) Transcript_47493:40-876(-)